MTRKRKAVILLLFIIGGSIIVYPHLAQRVHHSIQIKQSNEFHEMKSNLREKDIATQIKEAEKCNEAIFKNEENVYDPFTEGYDREAYEACKDAPEEGNKFATIELPKLGLEIPVYLGATDDVLAKGIGQVDGSSLPIGGMSTHTVLAGHRGMGTKAMFRNLDELAIGDTFYIHTLEGTLRYDVSEVEVILPHETNNLLVEEGKDRASLITCHPYRANSHRLVVHGERSE